MGQDSKSVKVDNWGVFFLQKLQNFFNKTDYCDLTLQFMDNSQLKVHRLVLSACTDYFNVLELQTDCTDDILNMPYDLQADVVVPIVNFMYTGTLEFEVSMYARLLKTAKDMNMTVLLKLLEAHKRTVDVQPQRAAPVLLNKGAAASGGAGGGQMVRGGTAYGRGGGQQRYTPTPPRKNAAAGGGSVAASPALASGGRQPQQQQQHPVRLGVRPVAGPAQRRVAPNTNAAVGRGAAPASGQSGRSAAASVQSRGPSRYDPAADQGDQYETTFDAISYESRPLQTARQLAKDESDDGDATSRSFEQLRRGYTGVKRPAAATTATSSGESPPEKKPNIEDVKEYIEAHRMRKKIVEEFNEDQDDEEYEETAAATATSANTSAASKRQSGGSANDDSVDHQKIISEVLKKYPHLVKSNKNIKLKITQKGQQQTITAPLRKAAAAVGLPTKTSSTPSPSGSAANAAAKPQPSASRPSTSTTAPAAAAASSKPVIATPAAAPKKIDSKTMHALIALGAENTTGPWLCLKCGINGRPISIPSYKGFRRHLITVHKLKIDPKLCELCGWRSSTKTDLHHHGLVVHNVAPPADVHFPKCGECVYVAVDTRDLALHRLDKHEKTATAVATTSKTQTQQQQQHCIYCNKTFATDRRLLEHIKLLHKKNACEDGLIDEDEESDDDDDNEEEYVPHKPALQQKTVSEKRKVNVLSSITLPPSAKNAFVLDAQRAKAAGGAATTIQAAGSGDKKQSSATTKSSDRRSGTLDPVTGAFADDDEDLNDTEEELDGEHQQQQQHEAENAAATTAAATASATTISQDEAESNEYLEFVMAEVHGEKKSTPTSDAKTLSASGANVDAAAAAGDAPQAASTDSTQFVNADGATVELTEEQKKELIDQLHDGSKNDDSVDDDDDDDDEASTSAKKTSANVADELTMEWDLDASMNPLTSTEAADANASQKASQAADKAKELVGEWSADETDDSLIEDGAKAEAHAAEEAAGGDGVDSLDSTAGKDESLVSDDATTTTTMDATQSAEVAAEATAAEVDDEKATDAKNGVAQASSPLSSATLAASKRSYAGRSSRDSNKSDEQTTSKAAAETKTSVPEEADEEMDVADHEDDDDEEPIDEPKRDPETMKKDSNIEIKSLINDWGDDDEDETMDKSL